MSHWMQIAHPHARAWRHLVEAATGRGLVHAMESLPILVGNYSPADVASLLAEMVEHGALVPVKLDLAGAGHSVRAFRGIGPSAGGRPSSKWERAEAHLWTYSIAAPHGCTDPADEHADCEIACGLVGCDPKARRVAR